MEWKHLEIPSFGKRLSWISQQEAELCIEIQVRKKYIEPKYVIDRVGPRIRPCLRDRFADGNYPPLDDTRYIERAVYFKGFSKPTVLSESELYGT